MQQKGLFEKITMALAKTLNGKIVEDINLDTKLRDDLGLDSITSLTFLMTLEETIDGFVVDPATLDIDDLNCVQTIAQYVERQLLRA